MERVFGANHPDPVEIEKAKRVLKVGKATMSSFCTLFFSFSFFFLSFFFPKANCINNLLFFTIQEQEQALIDAISRLADISDGESGTSLSFLYHL